MVVCLKDEKEAGEEHMEPQQEEFLQDVVGSWTFVV